MKKILLLSIMLFAVAITGCEKDDAASKENPMEQTLEELYPEWVNTTRIFTSGSLISNRVPLNPNEDEDWTLIKIQDNQGVYIHENKYNPNPNIDLYKHKYFTVFYDASSTATLKTGYVCIGDVPHDLYNVGRCDNLHVNFEMNTVDKTIKLLYYDTSSNQEFYYLLKYN